MNDAFKGRVPSKRSGHDTSPEVHQFVGISELVQRISIKTLLAAITHRSRFPAERLHTTSTSEKAAANSGNAIKTPTRGSIPRVRFSCIPSASHNK